VRELVREHRRAHGRRQRRERSAGDDQARAAERPHERRRRARALDDGRRADPKARRQRGDLAAQPGRSFRRAPEAHVAAREQRGDDGEHG
jgi:hypothetical protein